MGLKPSIEFARQKYVFISPEFQRPPTSLWSSVPLEVLVRRSRFGYVRCFRNLRYSSSDITFFFCFSGWGETESTCYVGHCWPIVPTQMTDGDYGAVGGMRIGRGNRSTRRKPAPVLLCPPQIPHDLGLNPGRRGGKPAITARAVTRPLAWLASISCLHRLDFNRMWYGKFVLKILVSQTCESAITANRRKWNFSNMQFWSLIHRLRVFENRGWGEYLDRRGMKW
jgi:hypothetical protein